MRRESYRSGSSQPSTKNSLVGRNFSLAGAFATFGGKKGENIGPWVLAFCSKDQKSFASPLPDILRTSHFGQEASLSLTSALFLHSWDHLPHRQMSDLLLPEEERLSPPLPHCTATAPDAHTQGEPEATLVTICVASIPAHSPSSASGPTPISLLASPHLFLWPLFPSLPSNMGSLKDFALVPFLFPFYGNFHGFMLQINLISVFKAQPFLLRSRLCKFRCRWNIFIYLKITVPQIEPFIFFPKPPSHPVFYFRDWHLSPYSHNSETEGAFQNSSFPSSLIFIWP